MGMDYYSSLPILHRTDLYSRIFQCLQAAGAALVMRHHFACFDIKTRLLGARMFASPDVLWRKIGPVMAENGQFW